MKQHDFNFEEEHFSARADEHAAILKLAGDIYEIAQDFAVKEAFFHLLDIFERDANTAFCSCRHLKCSEQNATRGSGRVFMPFEPARQAKLYRVPIGPNCEQPEKKTPCGKRAGLSPGPGRSSFMMDLRLDASAGTDKRPLGITYA